MQEAMFVTSPYRPNHLQLKFYTIMQYSKRVLGFNCKKKIEQLNFFDWLWNVKNLVFWNGSELMRNVIRWDLNSFFFQKLTKIAQRLGALPPDPHSHRRLGLCPQTPVSDTFEYTSLRNASSKLDFYTFQQLVFVLSLYQNPGKVPSGYGFRSSILRYLCPTKNYFFENFWWCHCVLFVVWAPPIKNPGYTYALWSSISILLLITTVVRENTKIKWNWRNNRLCCHYFYYRWYFNCGYGPPGYAYVNYLINQQ